MLCPPARRMDAGSLSIEVPNTVEMQELLWRQYHLHGDLYKHYLDVVPKINAAYYASIADKR